ncbi:ACID PHOSPHATASE-LIKE PROTEIN [Salix koriyanagi]|uniref:ACID PHOSPHATASE-LIKE PROTEIN n=1 Tax=Salix koriyanagi TaxID=2511006 RepID=A0A9Q0WQ41_9ROSI|nr:ACID PHOSPHATASE-LIKE PROTEIN [Salix koriyanagi]
MGRLLGFLLCFSSFFISATFADWNILNQRTKSGLKISLKSYCEGWRINVELHNIQGFAVVPEECVSYIGKYVTSIQYKVDSERTIEECRLYLSTSCPLKKDGKDAWLFDIDDTLLSTVPYFKKHHFRGRKIELDIARGMDESGQGTSLGALTQVL